MKFCPVCQTRYDEEILRFCPNDGTPLVEENPSFREMPSESRESLADIDDETLVRPNRPNGSSGEMPATQPDIEEDSAAPQRIVISTDEVEDFETEAATAAAVRAKAQPQHEQPPQKSNTALIVLTTMFGTITVLVVLAGAWYVLSNRGTATNNRNNNVNTAPPNTNYNINLNNADNSLPANFDFNANADSNINVNVNANVNANLKSPSPTRTPSPSPTVTPDANANTNTNGNLNGNANLSPRPTGSPSLSPTGATPGASPRPSLSPTAPANVGIMNSRAVSLPKPAYPPTARQMNATGEVRVQVTVDENGNVTSARAISGHTLLRAPAVNAALQSRFNPVKVGERAIPATGVVVYNFINQ